MAQYFFSNIMNNSYFNKKYYEIIVSKSDYGSRLVLSFNR